MDAMQPTKFLKRPVGTVWLGALLGALLAHAASAASSFAPPDTNAVYNYTIASPGNPPPVFDATNFIINGSFTVNSEALTINTELYEPLDVVNYVISGTMTNNTGFKFDSLTNGAAPGHAMAGSFYNGGEISCASFTDTSVAFFTDNLLLGLYAGEFIASATNIVNPGAVDVGTGGLMQFTGQNMDLSQGTFTVEAFDLFNPFFYNPGLNSIDYGVGVDTNGEWQPAFDLTPTTALSSLFSSQLIPVFNQLYLTNSSCYYYTAQPATNYIIYRAVFLNNNPGVGVSNNVYFGGDFVGAGAAHVEWVGTYLDPSTGNMASNYLYLSDLYFLGAKTNNPIINGIPENFTFAEGAQVFFGIPAPVQFPTNVFNIGPVTNYYSYVDAQLTPTTVSTNDSGNPYVTNYLAILPGRMQVSASQELNLAGAEITGPNYMSLSSPHQFDGASGAQVFVPYADINLGVTNGFLTISNLLEPSLPRWSGSVQAWSSDWIYVDANNITNDYRVLLVNSQLQPTTPAQVQNLALHSTNSVVISDVFNIMNSLYIDAPNLTLTTNGTSTGSADGELNLGNPGTTFSSATLPNLCCLTNDGAMRSGNSFSFGSSLSTNYTAFINNGLVSDQGATIYADYFENSGLFTNGGSSFGLQSLNTTLTNGLVTAGLDISIATGSFLASNAVIQAGRSLTISATNLLTDTGPTNGNIWTVGAVANNARGGFSLLVNPGNGDLLGTTITNFAPSRVTVVNTWAGNDFGYSIAGYNNNAAVGRLILDSLGTTNNTHFTFNGTGTSNAIYVDYLELLDQATNYLTIPNVGRVYSALNFNTNLVIYYAQAVVNGLSQAVALNHANNNHLRWMPYAGYFSSTNIVYPDGTTNAVNSALANDPNVDSDGDGKVNSQDSTPLFVPSDVNFTLTLTNVPPLEVKITWDSIPASTNYVQYRTNLLATNWFTLTIVTNAATVPPPGGWPITNSVYDTVNPAVQKFYRVHVDPNSTDLYGN